MKIIYLYNKNVYAALKAAYTHLKLKIPIEIKNIKHKYNEKGHFYYIGMDIELNEIYLLKSRKNNYILKNLLQGFSNLYDEEILIVDSDKFLKER